MININFCRVCGLDLGYPVWGEDGKSPTFDICPCCGTEFGYQDCNIRSIHKQRSLWLRKNKGEWHQIDEKPNNWDLKNQIMQIPKEFT